MSDVDLMLLESSPPTKEGTDTLIAEVRRLRARLHFNAERMTDWANDARLHSEAMADAGASTRREANRKVTNE